MIISLYAKGMTVRDIQHHLRVTLGSELSHETISNITEAVAAEVKAWQARPLEAIYPIIYLDALVVKVRDGHTVRNKAATLLWASTPTASSTCWGSGCSPVNGAKFWLGVLAELANRGVADAPMRVLRRPHRAARGDRGDLAEGGGADLHRAPDPGIAAVLPDMDRKAVAAALKMIYTAPPRARPLPSWTPSTARPGARSIRRRCGFGGAPGTVHPVPGVPCRRCAGSSILTNSVESLHYQLRKIIKNRGHFPNDDAVVKLLWLAIRDIEDRRAQERAKEAGLPKGQPRKAPPKLVEGAQVQHWNQALGALTMAFPGRLEQAL